MKKFWKKLKGWQKGGVIGLIFGLLKIPFFVLFGESLPELTGSLLSRIPDQLLCDIFNLGMGESCGFFVFFYGLIYNPIFYAIIGSLIGYGLDSGIKSLNQKRYK